MTTYRLLDLFNNTATYPDVWVPFVDNLDMLAGINPAKKKVKFGADTILFPDDHTVSFTRPSIATYVDKGGVLRTAGTDEPRFEREGLLIEGQSTNTHRFSDFSGGEFYKARCSVVRGTLTHGIQWYLMTATEGTSAAYVYLQGSNSQTFELDKTYTYSLFCKKASHGRMRLVMHNDSFPVNATVSYDYETKEFMHSTPTTQAYSEDYGDYVRLFVTAKCIKAGGNRSPLVWQDGFVVGDTWLIANPQIEEMASGSSYTPTSGAAATRAADRCSIVGNDNWGTTFTCAVEFTVPWQVQPNIAPRVFDIDTTVSTAYRSLSCHEDRTTGQFGVSNGWATDIKQSGSRSRLAGIGYDAERQECTVFTQDSIQRSSKVTVVSPWGGTVPFIRFGGQGDTGGARHLWGHIRNFRLWHRVLTDAQIKAFK